MLFRIWRRIEEIRWIVAGGFSRGKNGKLVYSLKLHVIKSLVWNCNIYCLDMEEKSHEAGKQRRGWNDIDRS